MWIYFLILFGLIYGILAPILGIGGGFFFVPTLNILFFLDIHLAITTSMFVILFTSISGTIKYYFTGRINKEIIKIGLILSVTTISGGILGSIFKEYISSIVLTIIFAISLASVGIYMIAHSIKEKEEENKVESSVIQENPSNKLILYGSFLDKENKTVKYSLNLPLVLPLTFFAGILSGLLGIGGGLINVPTLNVVCGLPIHFSVAASTFMIVIVAISNNLTNLFISSIDIFLGILLAIGAIIGAQIGPKLVEKISPRNLKIFFGIFTIVFSIYYIIK